MVCDLRSLLSAEPAEFFVGYNNIIMVSRNDCIANNGAMKIRVTCRRSRTR